MEIIIGFALALFICTALVPITIRYANMLGLVDAPDEERKQHETPIPRCGGIAIAIAVFVPALFWLRDLEQLFSFFIGAAIIFVFGVMDDRHELNYKWKFLGQILAIAIFLTGNLEVTKPPFFAFDQLPQWVSLLIMGLFILGVTNAVNLSDGLDGLAGGSSLLSLGFIAYLAFVADDTSLVFIAVTMVGAIMGFLRYNTHPASVFMGDTGSQFIGYIIACLAVMVTQSPTSAVSPILAIMVVGLPILDTLMVMLLRLRDGQSPFYPDRRHLHHQFLSIGLRHYQAVGALYLLNFALLALAYLIRYQSDLVVTLFYCLFCLSTLAVIAYLKQTEFAHKRAEKVKKMERRNLWLRKIGWMHKNGVLLVQIVLGVYWLLAIVLSPDLSGLPDYFGVVVIALTAVFWQVFSSASVHSRFLLYLISVCAIYAGPYMLVTDQAPFVLSDQILTDIILGILVFVLVLSIRMSRREQFRLDNQDVLVLLVLLAAPILSLGLSEDANIIGLVIRFAVLLYAVEFVIGRSPNRIIATLFALLSFILLSLKAYF